MYHYYLVSTYHVLSTELDALTYIGLFDSYGSFLLLNNKSTLHNK